MGGKTFGWLAVWVPSPDWLCRMRRNQVLGWSRRTWGGGIAGRAPTLYWIPWHLPYNWGKSRKTSVRVAYNSNSHLHTHLYTPSPPPLPAGLLTPPHWHTASYWLCDFPAQTQPGINSTHSPATDILHSPAYEDGTGSEFRNVGN